VAEALEKAFRETDVRLLGPRFLGLRLPDDAGDLLPLREASGMTKPLRWRSQLCPCGYCPPGTRIYWRHNVYELLFNLDVHFRPRARARDDDVKAHGGT